MKKNRSLLRKVSVVGAGLAGCEAAWYLAERGIDVELFEMRPHVLTPAHKTSYFAELVCSNSLKSDHVENSSGLLKAELRECGSFLIRVADDCRIPGGKALVVDRNKFSLAVTNLIESHPRIRVKREEFAGIDINNSGSIILIASGPLTSSALSNNIAGHVMKESLYFYDAISPIVDADSIDMGKCFYADRYGKGTGDYLNCPMSKEEFDIFYDALVNGERTEIHEFDKVRYFEGCLPVEEIAARGHDALRFGPMKPVGILGPAGEKYYAVVQLRKENMASSSFNMVGFQTRLRHKEQEKVLSLIPGLENVRILRYGSMHRNTFINSPLVLDHYMRLNSNPLIYFAGQITGSEGYVEAIATGLFCGINIYYQLIDEDQVLFPRETAIGALCNYLTDPINGESFQPMNFNFGLLPSLDGRHSKKKRAELKSNISLVSIKDFSRRISAVHQG
ncbi:MAG: methylenetetrahydrofolate--tRNA-(uracil(54)-C(5))-methyltransferase (FADH(2)-oxidizing) TrmFO [Candidatus Schekmanbacteria bacterium]|nr:methylenetetrahydrofolate--tRNA-(uracil(54)-C(5))-methyltransferase (FADH(2)-oxidizing) TrmFO [Candidatus Schekmanbacteria bacterium]